MHVSKPEANGLSMLQMKAKSLKRYFIDTNLIVRFITGQPEDQAKIAAQFLQKSDRGEIVIYINPIVVAEVVFVLTGKVYGYNKDTVVEALIGFLDNPAFIVQELESLQTALDLFAKHNVDFVDAYIGASAKMSRASVATFDQDFKKFRDIRSLNLKAKKSK